MIFLYGYYYLFCFKEINELNRLGVNILVKNFKDKSFSLGLKIKFLLRKIVFN